MAADVSENITKIIVYFTKIAINVELVAIGLLINIQTEKVKSRITDSALLTLAGA